MRAVGVTLVILNHMWPWEGHPLPVVSLLAMAWMLMDAFFVISGFLITGILLDSRTRSDYYKSFYTRRALRILPVYYAVLILITAITILNGHSSYKEMLDNWGSPWWFFVYLGNIPTAISGLWPLAAGGAFVPLWSLQVEEQFYLLFPFLVHKVRLQTVTRILIVLCCVSTALRLAIYWVAPQNQLAEYVLLPCRMEGLAIGAWIAIRFRQGPWKVDKRKLSFMALLFGALSLGSTVAGGFEHIRPWNRTIGFLISPMFFGFVILWLIHYRGTSKTAWLRSPAMQYVGKISYAAYLLHWPVSNILTLIVARLRMPSLDTGLCRLFLIYAMTFAASALSWHFFESPMLTLKDKLFPAGRIRRSA